MYICTTMNGKKVLKTVSSAFDKLSALSGISILELESSSDSVQPFLADVRVCFKAQETKYEIFSEFRSEIREKSNTHMRLLMRYFNNSDRDGIVLVSNYIHPEMKTYLRTEGINYLETSGNCCIKMQGLFLYVDGQKNQRNRVKIKNKSFNLAGLKTIITLLLDPDLINSSYRNIAKASNVSLGSIGSILEDLKNQGYLVESTNGKVLKNKKELFERWAELHPHTLQVKNLVGFYKVSNSKKQFNENEEWYLSAFRKDESKKALEQYTLYTNLDASEFKSKLGLTKNISGRIEVYRPFWNIENETFAKNRMVNALLNYADLKAHKTKGGELTLSRIIELQNEIKPLLNEDE